MNITVVDTVRADTLEVGDMTWWGTISELSDNGDYVVATLEAQEVNEEVVSFWYTDNVDLLAIVYDVTV